MGDKPDTSDGKGPFESLLERWVVVISVVYATGYIVLSLRNIQLGINPTSPLRPSSVAAGVLFWIICLLAFLSGRWVESVVVGWGIGGAFCVAVTLATLLVADVIVLYLIFPNLVACALTPHPATVISTTVLFVVLVTRCFCGPRKVIWPWVIYIFGSTCLLSLICGGVFGIKGPDQTRFILFVFLLQIATRIIHYVLTQTKTEQDCAMPWLIRLLGHKERKWFVVTILSLLSVYLFSKYISTHVRPAFGGGQVNLATFQLRSCEGISKELRLRKRCDSTNPSLSSVYLLEENEYGVFIPTGDKDMPLLFLPRETIRSVIFSGQPVRRFGEECTWRDYVWPWAQRKCAAKQ